AVKPAVDFFAQNGCDTIILGCTHFTHIAKDIQAAAGKDVRVVDSREGVAKQALRVEQDAGLNIGGQKSLDQISSFPDASFFVTSASAVQEEEYKTLCKNFGIPWGGII
ncbi:MAG: aspartate/glutamate racemase family protein, partial [Treponema sp.]|nr:aspartate/glutamate racemase family protein [Treponema sp.]